MWLLIKYRLFLTFLIVFIPFISVKAQPAGPNNPSTSGIDMSVGTVTWSNIGNVYSSDDSRSVSNLNGITDITYYLTATNFGFSIPAGSSIDGIVVEIERADNGGGGIIKDNKVEIIKGGSIVGVDQSSGTIWSSIDTCAIYGAPTDLWGVVWTVANINASDFGVAISAKRLTPGANNQGKIDHIRITVYYTSPLPIELIYFKGTNKENSILLEWMTASEYNNDHFTIERSTDAVQFTKIGTIKGYGNSSTNNFYQLFDYEPTNGVNYYRLTQIDFNGQSEAFLIVVQNFMSTDTDGTLKVFDFSGKIVHSVDTIFSKRIEVVSVLPLKKGIYVIYFKSNNGNNVFIEKYFLPLTK